MYLLCTYMYFYLSKYLYVIKSVFTLLTYPLHFNPPLNRPIPPNLSQPYPYPTLIAAKVLCNMNTICTL